MAIVTKTIPYEILIRFSEGADHQQKKVGEFEGAHYIERVRLFDDETGEIVGTPKGEENDRPKELPKDKVAEYLGAPFVAFEEQNRALQQRLDEMTKQRDALQDDVGARDSEIAKLGADKAQLIAVVSAARAALG